MELVKLPTWDAANLGITAVQIFALGGCVGELQGQNAGYSKFAHPERKFKLKSRLGMVILYSPGLAASLYYLATVPRVGGNGRELATASLLALHYGKRVLECLFLHKYSGSMDGDFLIPVSTFYALTAVLYAHQQKTVESYQGAHSQLLYRMGVALALFGQMGNFYHHYLLTKLRDKDSCAEDTPSQSPSRRAAYKIPSGGLFRFVTMPHYFFEIIAWFGLACVTQHFNAFLAVLDMISYLGGRSVANTRWYKSKFENYPSDRKHLVPFIF
jgi:very-long-chain enoyl-CoA reductase